MQPNIPALGACPTPQRHYRVMEKFLVRIPDILLQSKIMKKIPLKSSEGEGLEDRSSHLLHVRCAALIPEDLSAGLRPQKCPEHRPEVWQPMC